MASRYYGRDFDGVYRDEGMPNLVEEERSWAELLEDPDCEMGCLNSCTSNCQKRCCF